MSTPTPPATFWLDGHAVPFAPGQTIMQAVQAAGGYIPHLCHHADLPPIGSCKVCSVRIKGRLVASCTYPASEGLEVESEQDDIRADRKRLVQMLFAEGNHHCPFCEKSGNCHLQALAYHLGMQDTHFVHVYPKHDVDASHPDLLLDRSRCVLCELCVRASRDIDGKSVFAMAGRGLQTHLIVNSPSGLLKDSDIAASDRAMSICPVGALMPKHQGFQVPIGERLYDHTDIAQRPEDT